MISIKNLDRICLFSVIVIALLCAGLVVNLVAKKRKQIKHENDLFSKQMMNLKLTEAKLRNFKDTVGVIEQRIESFNERIPDSPEIGKFFQDVDAMIKARDLTLVSVQPQSSKPEKSLTKIPVKMMFKGKFINIHQMVQEIESINRIVVMEQLKITRAVKGKQCQVDLLANIFRR